MDTLLKEIIRIAKTAGKTVKEMRDAGQLSESLKDGVELVTNADLAAHDIIRKEILRLYPDHDPIDGTVNYANGHFMSAISIAYAKNHKTRIGVVYNPFLDELFYASEGGGAYLNGQRICVKNVSKLNECLVATGFPYVRDTVPELVRRLERVLPRVRDIRRLGSAALDICWVACGRLQGYYEAALHIWDAAAGLLIAEEAGAAVGQFVGEPDNPLPVGLRSSNLIVTSPGVYEELKALLV
jgi:myo-inositol-1(or 4)-monophosphatase